MFLLRHRILIIVSNKTKNKTNYYLPNADVIELDDFMGRSVHEAFKYNSISVYLNEPKDYTLVTLSLLCQCTRYLQPGGIINLHLNPTDQDDAFQVISKTAWYSGFIDPKQVDNPQGHKLHMIIQYPQWAKPNIEEPKKEEPLIDEFSLLSNEETYIPLGKESESCASKPRACANCTCGRKELEQSLGAEEAVKQLQEGNIRSSCGNCYLGDAFRCSGCPYKGQPAFKPGDKIQLDVQNMDPEAALSKVSPAEDHTFSVDENEDLAVKLHV